ncbi:MAG: galactokinase [Planctomycetota bacterium]|jgi:galactokinase|nr:galactokinase [Planctomycetota bacterium]
MMTPSDLARCFDRIFGAEIDTKIQTDKRRLFFAPGRVNLIGEHTDYNGGHVLPCALSLGTRALAAPRADRRCRVASLNLPGEGVAEFSLDAAWDVAETGWSRYPRSVFSIFERHGLSLARGMDILYYGDLPAGAGLSSSASIEVLTGYVARELGGLEISRVYLALLAQEAENERVGVQCGIMDQFAVAMGKRDRAILLDCGALKHRYCALSLPGARLIITNSNKPHSLAASKYNSRRRECEQALAALRRSLNIRALCEIDAATFERHARRIDDGVIRRRARHVVSENQRVLEAAAFLENGDLEGFGGLMYASHASMRDDFAISCPEMDLLVALASSVPGVYGSRMTGGGFGGCTVSLVREEAVDEFRETLERGYRSQTGYAPSFYLCETSDGAMELPVRDS